jgi:hypothetical protein
MYGVTKVKVLLVLIHGFISMINLASLSCVFVKVISKTKGYVYAILYRLIYRDSQLSMHARSFRVFSAGR